MPNPFRDGEMGSFPDLEKLTLERLAKIKPNRYLTIAFLALQEISLLILLVKYFVKTNLHLIDPHYHRTN